MNKLETNTQTKIIGNRIEVSTIYYPNPLVKEDDFFDMLFNLLKL